LNLFQEFHGPNSGYVMELYERFLQDPRSVDASAQELFSRYGSAIENASAIQNGSAEENEKRKPGDDRARTELNGVAASTPSSLASIDQIV